MAPLTRKRKAELEHVQDAPELPHSLGWKPDLSKVEFVKPAPKRVKRLFDSEELTPKPDQSPPSLKTAAKKAIKYHFTPGSTPYPNHLMPTPEACEEVNRILSKAHGKVEAPKIIATPSMKVAGCGEVPDLLDALIRTRLSATTSSTNANRALEGLQKAYGLQTTGPGKGSINWDAVRRSDIPAITEAIKRGGHQNVKSVDIKVILDTVYAQNVARLEFLLHGTKSEDPENAVLEEEPASPEAKGLEISKLKENMLSLDRIMRMKPFEAMGEMMKFKGIGVKTSSCVLLFCMKIPSFAVDTHVWRHCKWLGWVPEKANRDQTYSHCEVRVPDHLKYSLHQLLIMHGKKCYRCKSNTAYGTAKWNQTVCPIEHLVNRMDAKKQPGYVSPKKEVVEDEKGGVKRKRAPGKKVIKGKKIKKEVELDSDQELSEDVPEISESEFGPGEDAEV
ncbi:HhH-GPD family base excision DNA repair protein [Leptodontidium sp. MPI-SDFR-AT-0119]|nr:HhH-GPD family base excision DNA repair protein [Leptodontidium sp. MPI-SDFR-AT-0119]